MIKGVSLKKIANAILTGLANIGGLADLYLSRYAAKQLLISGDGTGLTTNAGIIVGYEGSNSGYSAIWSSTITPSSSNYGIRFVGSETSINGPGSQGAIYLNVNNSTRLTVNPDTAAGSGALVTGGTATTDVAAFSVTRTNNNAAVATGVKFTFTDTSSAAGFLPLSILGGSAGTTSLLALSKTGGLAIPGTMGIRSLSTLTDGADGTNTSAYKFVSFVSNSAEAGNVIRVAQTSAVVFTTSSDARLKNVLGDADRAAASKRIMAHRMRDYEWKASPGTVYVGPVAQEAYEANASPMLVQRGGADPQKNPWSVNMSGYVPDLIMAVQELTAEVARLKSRH